MWPEKIKYFTFQEVLALYPARCPSKPHASDIAPNWFLKMLDDAGLEIAVYTLSELIDDEIIEEVINALMTIVYERHAYDYFYGFKMEWDEDLTLNTYYFPDAMRNLLNVINLTLPRYIPLLQQNEEFSEAPVSPIHSKSTGRTRFNDTPQDEGLYNNEEHATNVSKSISETEVDSGSIVSRLDELFKNWKSIILEWSNEFNRLFFKEEQL